MARMVSSIMERHRDYTPTDADMGMCFYRVAEQAGDGKVVGVDPGLVTAGEYQGSEEGVGACWLIPCACI